MVYIFDRITIQNYYFTYLFNITHDLWSYLYDNLKNENYNLLRDLTPILSTNANGEYI
jgi:hypothetical protein